MPKETFFNLQEEKREKVVRAAIGEFSKNGYDKGNIGDIAKNAGVAKGSMYQYFENKKELFLYCVQWSTQLLLEKTSQYKELQKKPINLFDFFYESSKDLWIQLREERELVIFIQDVFLGKYNTVNDESMDYMIKASEEYLLLLIEEGKENGSIRKDVDNHILSLFMMGVSIKFKQYIMNRAKEAGEELIDEAFERNEKEIKAMIELLKNGMGVK